MGVAMASETVASAIALILVEEMSHRVLHEYTGAILALSSAAAEATDPAGRLALTDVACRLEAYANVHRALTPPLGPGQADLGEYMARLCAALASARLADLGVHLTLVANDAPTTPARCWRVGLIIYELVTNSLRHGSSARGGSLAIQICVRDGMIWCRVSDNGGRAPLRVYAGRGRSIVEALVRDLGGDVDWDFAKEGTTVALAIPSDATASIKRGTS
jgi:two-component sensor histidine kinase